MTAYASRMRVPFDRRRMVDTGVRYLPSVALVVLAIGIWEGLCRLLDVPSYLWPTPSRIVQDSFNDAGLLGAATVVTVREVVW